MYVPLHPPLSNFPDDNNLYYLFCLVLFLLLSLLLQVYFHLHQ